MILYYSVIVGVIALIMVLALTTENSINCIDNIFSYHWFLLDAVDFAQSVLIIVSAVFIVKYMRKSMLEQTLQLRTLSYEMKSMNSLQT